VVPKCGGWGVANAFMYPMIGLHWCSAHHRSLTTVQDRRMFQKHAFSDVWRSSLFSLYSAYRMYSMKVVCFMWLA